MPGSLLGWNANSRIRGPRVETIESMNNLRLRWTQIPSVAVNGETRALARGFFEYTDEIIVITAYGIAYGLLYFNIYV